LSQINQFQVACSDKRTTIDFKWLVLTKGQLESNQSISTGEFRQKDNLSLPSINSKWRVPTKDNLSQINQFQVASFRQKDNLSLPSIYFKWLVSDKKDSLDPFKKRHSQYVWSRDVTNQPKCAKWRVPTNEQLLSIFLLHVKQQVRTNEQFAITHGLNQPALIPNVTPILDVSRKSSMCVSLVLDTLKIYNIKTSNE
jgi:hypothetical protein